MKIVKPTVVFLREFAPGNPLELINQAARTCYKSEGEAVEMFRRVIASGHTSTIEHVQLSFRIVADRGVLNELVRHRIGCSFSQESTRYCNYGKAKFGHEIAVIKPDDIVAVPEADSVWTEVVEHIEQGYMRLLDIGVKPQIARSLLPLGLKSEVVVSMNIRSLRHFLGLRMAAAAHPQMREIADEVYARVREYCPVLVEGLALPLKEQPAKAKELRSVYSAEGYKLEDDLGQIHKCATAAAVAEYHGVDSVSREDLRTICALHGRSEAQKMGLRWAGVSCSDAEPVPARPPAGCPAPEHSVLVTDTDGKQRWKHVQDVGPGDVLMQLGLGTAPAVKPAVVPVPELEVYGFYDDTDCVVLTSTGTVLDVREIPALSFGGRSVSRDAKATARSRTMALAVAHGGTYAGVPYCPGIREIYEQDPRRFRDLARDLLRDGTDEKASEVDDAPEVDEPVAPEPGTVPVGSRGPDLYTFYDDTHYVVISSDNKVMELCEAANHSDNKILELCEVTGFQPPSLIGLVRAFFLAKLVDGRVLGSTRYDGVYAASKALPPEVFGKTLLNTVDDRHTAPAPEPATIPATEMEPLYGFYDDLAYVLIRDDGHVLSSGEVTWPSSSDVAENMCRNTYNMHVRLGSARPGTVHRYPGLSKIWNHDDIADILLKAVRAGDIKSPEEASKPDPGLEVYAFYDTDNYVLVNGQGTVLESGAVVYRKDAKKSFHAAAEVVSTAMQVWKQHHPESKLMPAVIVTLPLLNWKRTDTGKTLVGK